MQGSMLSAGGLVGLWVYAAAKVRKIPRLIELRWTSGSRTDYGGCRIERRKGRCGDKRGFEELNLLFLAPTGQKHFHIEGDLLDQIILKGSRIFICRDCRK